ncbi:S1/P1 nuclease-domain-containing protein [Chytridium lagenaria]|nr:S1/P1 nuclease-domain-containing protein [Chytridium lagenaria]
MTLTSSSSSSSSSSFTGMLTMIPFLILISSSVVSAWGSFGHSVTGEMAQKLLSDNGRALVAKLVTKDYVKATVIGTLTGSASSWADTWKSSHPVSAPWHYVDMMANSPAACGYVASDCADRNCIVSAITDQTQILLSNKCAVTPTSSQALLYLSHFLGDITQPLHTCNRQVGGNEALLVYASKPSNFHAIHDTQIPVQRSKEVQASNPASYANYLISTYASTSHLYNTSTFIDISTVDSNNIYLSAIAQSVDSNNLDCSKSGFWTLYDQNPSQDFSTSYYEAVKIPLEEQLAKGGFRMASWINAIADACNVNGMPVPPPLPPSPPVSSPSPPLPLLMPPLCLRQRRRSQRLQPLCGNHHHQ